GGAAGRAGDAAAGDAGEGGIGEGAGDARARLGGAPSPAGGAARCAAGARVGCGRGGPGGSRASGALMAIVLYPGTSTASLFYGTITPYTPPPLPAPAPAPAAAPGPAGSSAPAGARPSSGGRARCGCGGSVVQRPAGAGPGAQRTLPALAAPSGPARQWRVPGWLLAVVVVLLVARWAGG